MVGVRFFRRPEGWAEGAMIEADSGHRARLAGIQCSASGVQAGAGGTAPGALARVSRGPVQDQRNPAVRTHLSGR